MFQNFDAPSAPVTGDSRLRDLRNWMQAQQVSMVLVPHNDEQFNEYLPVNKERLAWISGFTGSAGSALITLQDAILFVDGRYTLQAAEQADGNHWRVESLIDNPPHKWLQSNASSEDGIGIDPWLHSASQVKQLNGAAEASGAVVRHLPENPIDAIWHDQPPTPLEPTRIHDFSFAGRTTADKLEEMQTKLEANKADLCVLTDPSSICWLFNIRGNDVVHTPITLAHAILRNDNEPLLFIDQRKLDIETKAFLTQVADLHPPSDLEAVLEDISPQSRVMLDSGICPFGFNQLVEKAKGTVVDAKDPVSLARATKNDVELDGARNAHRRDGAAMVTFLAWLNEQRAETMNEISVAQKLEQIRFEMAGNMPMRDVSFDTISGSGPNGAIVHYRVNQDTNRQLQNGELYLCDSGAQYDDGTTDITRTMAIGTPGEDERRAYTLVLKGHIAIALARFPGGTRGMDIDILARMALWQHGMDYAHGTGHGIGSYLAVHEGPQNISKRGTQELLPGMILSNEPGYYRTGRFGIRIENLIIVREALEIDGGDRPMMGFETITMAPLDQRLIDPVLMSDDELHWLNAYHGWVRRELEPLVDDATADWLQAATEPMIRDLPSASA